MGAKAAKLQATETYRLDAVAAESKSLFIIYERGQDDGGKTAFVDEAHARPQAFIDASYISAAVFSSAVDAEYAFSKISPPEPPAPLTLPDDGS